MLTQANSLYRLSVEKTKTDLDRAENYTERNRKRLAADASPATAARSSRAATAPDCASSSSKRPKLPAGQRIPPIDAALAATGQGARRNTGGRAAGPPVRIDEDRRQGRREEAMFAETTAQLTARKDSMIDFAASLRRSPIETDQDEATRDGAMSRIRPVMLDALRVANGGRLYPDANSTLRVGFGQVKGYAPRDAVGTRRRPTCAASWKKSTGEVPFNSPQRLLDRAQKHSSGRMPMTT